MITTRKTSQHIYIMVAFMLVIRIASIFFIGVDEISDCDDVAYLQGGITFARSGVISVWTDQPTAMIMPGTTVLTGIMCMLFGEGTAYLFSLKLLWCVMGSFVPLYIYKAAELYLPEKYALLVASMFFLPNHVWLDNVIVTETPYMLFSCANLYYMLLLAREPDRKNAVKYSVSFVCALLFRANIIAMLPFAVLIVLMCKKYSVKEMLDTAKIFVLISLLFFVPWTIRNYVIFDAFIPVSYGAANPTLKGTYWGNAPDDAELDYETNVYAAVKEKHAKYFDENGEIKDPAQEQYVLSLYDGQKAKYRISEWIKKDPKDFLKTFLITKPFGMLTWVYYWGPYSNRISVWLNIISKINFALCATAVLLSLTMKKLRKRVLLLTLIYWVNLYIIAMSYAVERYAALLMPIRYILSGIGIWLLVQLLQKAKAKMKA